MITFIEKNLATTTCVDVIWDRYLSDSLKAITRQCRGARVRQQLPSNVNGKIPKNWNSYLQNETNLSGMIAQFDEGITTSDKNIFQIFVQITMWFEQNILSFHASRRV